VHYIAAPGVVIGLIPWLLTGWQASTPGWPRIVQVLGGVLLVAGATVVTAEFVRFVREGGGSPAPVAPTRKLVTGGLYRDLRNPMYVAVVSAIIGQALLLGSPVLLVYAAVTMATVWAFAHWYEEPTLRRTFGHEYDDYCRRVPGWLPRITRDQRRSKAT
jgi:protein-S-isoprenylcysteine O-methyltransferase Ste14